ncbi:MAG: alpha-galactosidase [Candidatus Omnitrophota bacterium]
MHRRRYFSIALVMVLSPAWAVAPNSSEFDAARYVFERYFLEQNATASGFLQVLEQDVPEGITRGQSWRGTPYRIGGKEYSNGVAFNATKRLLINLGGPGERFQSDVGLENNDNTQLGAKSGNGSVRFHVFVKGQEVYASPIMRLQDEAQRVDAALNGADSFEILVDDAGDGRGWDQALWGEATAILKGGGRVRLQDLPWRSDLDYNPFLFSFLYDDQPSQKRLSQWTRRVTETSGGGLRRTVSYADPETKLEIRAEGVLDADFPVMEWVIYFKNNGGADTPILANIQAMDAVLPLPSAGSTRLHWAKGGVASFDDFAPQETALNSKEPFRLHPGGGRSSNQVMPFFNLEGSGGGIVAAVGWSGEWAAEFGQNPNGSAIMKAGMDLTHLRLHPGEEIRTPRMMLLFYKGDRWRGQNLLRQYILARHRPRLNGEPLIAPITNGNWGGTSAEVHLDNIRKIANRSLPIDYYWIDAEWYGQPGVPGTWAVNVGNWNVKKDLYPQGFKPLSDALRQSGRELMLWFEPERVHKGTPWYSEHHDWLFDNGGSSVLFNLGNPEACAFLINFISDKIDEFGLGCYRQDFNIDPLPFWRKADAPDRQGISEIRHIEGLYAFWDELLRRHPGLIIDNCASGGRRIDLETIGRSTPFWRTDGPRDPIAHQCHTFGLLPWVPLSATSQDRAQDDYEFRSSMCSSLCLNWWVSGDAPAERIPEDFPYEWAKNTLNQYREYRKYYYGNFYPVTAYTQSRDAWMAYQLDRPDLGEGLVVILKRPQSPYTAGRLALHELDPEANYQISPFGGKVQETLSGKELMEKGANVALMERPDSALLLYKRID